MCVFCKNLVSGLGLVKYKTYNDFYIEKNKSKVKKFNDTIKFTTCTNGGRLIPMNVICEAKKQCMQNGINSININWFHNTFNKPFSSVPYSLKILKEIVQ